MAIRTPCGPPRNKRAETVTLELGDAVSSGGTLDLAAFAATNAISLSGTGNGTNPALWNSSTTCVTLAGAITLNADAAVGHAAILSVAGGKIITLTDFAFSNIIGWHWLNAAQGTYTLINGGVTVSLVGTTPTSSNPFDFGNGKSGYFHEGSLPSVSLCRIIFLSGKPIPRPAPVPRPPDRHFSVRDEAPVQASQHRRQFLHGPPSAPSRARAKRSRCLRLGPGNTDL